jgi:hypothetical protein
MMSFAVDDHGIAIRRKAQPVIFFILRMSERGIDLSDLIDMM